MKKVVYLVGALLLPGMAVADSDSFLEFFDVFPHYKGVKAVSNELYDESCGECHYAFQPGLLPKRSWEKMMKTEELEDHFGENAELDEEDQALVLKFLVDNAADDSEYKRSIKIMRSIKAGDTPLRITQTKYIKRKHRELGKKHIENNKKVRSLSNCERCHKKIDEGLYDEDTVEIPGFSEWDDD